MTCNWSLLCLLKTKFFFVLQKKRAPPVTLVCFFNIFSHCFSILNNKIVNTLFGVEGTERDVHTDYIFFIFFSFLNRQKRDFSYQTFVWHFFLHTNFNRATFHLNECHSHAKIVGKLTWTTRDLLSFTTTTTTTRWVRKKIYPSVCK